MADDIVARARLQVSPIGLRDNNEQIMSDLCDEIERLRAETHHLGTVIHSAFDDLDNNNPTSAHAILKHALAGTHGEG